MQTICLKTLSEREFASTAHHRPARWPIMDWIADVCSEEFECDAEDVSLVENEETGEEIIHICGEPMARLIYRGL